MRFDEITFHILKFYNLYLLLDMYTDTYMHTHTQSSNILNNWLVMMRHHAMAAYYGLFIL